MAAKRRARDRRTGRDAAPTSRLQHGLSRIRSQLKKANATLAAKKGRADALEGVHFQLSQELLRALDQAGEDRHAATAKLSATGAALITNHTASLRHLEALHMFELESAKAKAAAPRRISLSSITPGHAQSRRCWLGHSCHGAGPAALASTARHAGVARSRNARLRDRSAIALCCTSCHVRLSSSPLSRLRPRRCPRDLAATLRSRLRSKMSQGQKGPLPASSCHAVTGAMIMPRRQPGDWAINSSYLLHRVSSAPSQTVTKSFVDKY